MRETKLYKTLQKLSGHELNRIHRFVISPYFNQSETLIRFFEWIKNDIKNNQLHSEPSKETIWKAYLQLNENYDDGRFRKFQSDLLKIIEEYYAQQAFEENPVQKAQYLLRAIEEKELIHLSKSSLKTATTYIENQLIRPSAFYYYQYEIEQSKYKLIKSSVERNTKTNIEEIAQNLDKFYLAEKLRYYCNILSIKKVAELDYNMLFIDEIMNHVNLVGYYDVPPIRLYYQIILTYRFPDDLSHYKSLRLLITKFIHVFPEDQVKDILDATFNYCVLKSNSGFPEFVRELFNLYKESLSNKSILIKGKITPWSFKNIVTAGLRLKEFEWVENFIHEFKNMLEDKFQNNSTTFSLAQLYFYKKDYSKVIWQLNQVEYTDVSYNLDSKILLMASYYELDEFEPLASLLETFRVYLSRNKEIPIARRKYFLNTISIVKKMARISYGDNMKIIAIRRDIAKTPDLVSKNWILEKLALLENQS